VGEQRGRHRETAFSPSKFIPGRSSQFRDPDVKHCQE
jgi:hypothetical protein